ncbi:MAG: hypothetical protein AB7O98_08860 [Hyphomonadaceae bacterium]
MSETAWTLDDVDPETRERAVAEAARLGVSLEDYIDETLLRGMLREHAAAEPEAPTFVASPQDNFAARHRLSSLERRLGVAVTGLDTAIHGLDSNLFNLASRLDETQAFAADTADTVTNALNEINGHVAAVRRRVINAEESLDNLSDAHSAAATEAEQRISAAEQRLTTVEHVARAADSAGIRLSDAHEALKHAVADDFADLAHDTATRLNAGLEEMRAIAQDAAAQADEASVRVVAELRRAREALEQRVEENALDIRERMQAAFADAADRMGALTERLVDHERRTAFTTDQLRATIADAEDSAQTALEETAETLRQAGAALGAELERHIAETRSALHNIHADLSREIGALNELQLGGSARLKLLDATVAEATVRMGHMRDALERRLDGADAAQQAVLAETRETLARVASDAQSLHAALEASIARSEAAGRESLARALSDWDARFDAMTARAAAGERDFAQAREALGAEISDCRQALSADAARIEACTFAALEKLSRDIAETGAALDAKLSQAALASEGLVAKTVQRVDAELTQVRDQHVGAMARLRLMDATLGEHAASFAPLADRLQQVEAALGRTDNSDILARLAQLEAAAAKAETEQALAIVRQQMAALGAEIERKAADGDALSLRVSELRASLAAHESQLGETASHVQGVVRTLGQVSKQSAELAAHNDERLQRIEASLKDIAGHTADAAAQAAAPAVDEVRALELRLARFEEQQLSAFEKLHAEVANFIGANDRRLAALEADDFGNVIDEMAAAIDTRFTRLEQVDFLSEFEALRRRLDDRILGVEQRSVRALEQVAETVALIERRFAGQGDQEDALAQSA